MLPHSSPPGERSPPRSPRGAASLSTTPSEPDTEGVGETGETSPSEVVGVTRRSVPPGVGVEEMVAASAPRNSTNEGSSAKAVVAAEKGRRYGVTKVGDSNRLVGLTGTSSGDSISVTLHDDAEVSASPELAPQGASVDEGEEEEGEVANDEQHEDEDSEGGEEGEDDPQTDPSDKRRKRIRWMLMSTPGRKREKRKQKEKIRTRLASVSLPLPSCCSLCFPKRNKNKKHNNISIPLYFRDPKIEAQFVAQLYPNDFRLMFFMSLITCLNLGVFGVFDFGLPLIIQVSGWRQESLGGQDGWLYVTRACAMLLASAGYFVWFLLPRCIALCVAKSRVRRMGRQGRMEEETEKVVETLKLARDKRLLSPTVVRVLEFGLFLGYLQHVILCDVAVWLAAVTDNRDVFGWSSLGQLGDSADFTPMLMGIGCFSLVVLVTPLRLGYLLVLTFTTIAWSLVTNCSALFTLLSTTSVGHAVGNAMFSILIPSILCVAAMQNMFVIRKLFLLKEKTSVHGAATAAAAGKLAALLSHVIPKRYVPIVQQNQVILLQARCVAALELDIESFTAWSSKKSPEAVIQYVHMLFTRFDRCDVGLKLRQAGDAWIALSLPHTGPRGILDMLKMAILALQCSESLNEETGESLNIRAGVGYSAGKGALVAWGTQTKSFDFVGRALEDAIVLEATASDPATVHVRTGTLSTLDDSLFGPLPFVDAIPTPLGVCLTRGVAGEIVVSCEERIVASASDGSIACTSPSLSLESYAQSVEGTMLTRMTTEAPDVTLRNVWATVKSDFCRCSPSNLVPRRRCLATFVCCFLCTVAQMVDLLVVSKTGLEHTIMCIVSPFLVLAVFTLFLVLFLRVPEGSLRVVLAVFSILVLSLRCGAVMLITSLCPVGLGSLFRILCWDWTFPLLHTHLNLLVVAGILVLPIVGQAMLFLHSHSVKVTSPEHLVEYLSIMLLIRVVYAFFVGPLSIFEALRKKWLTEAQNEVEAAVRTHDSLVKSRSTLVDSFIPGHVRDAFVEGQEQSGFEESVMGAICFVKFKTKEILHYNDSPYSPQRTSEGDVDLLAASIERINSQISELDEVALSFPGASKIKSTADSYLCVLRGGSLQDGVLLAIQLLRRRLPSILFQVGVQAGDRFCSGIIGSDRWVFDVVGAPINTAARLASVSAPNRITVLASTVSKRKKSGCHKKFAFRDAGFEELKGMGRVKLCVVHEFHWRARKGRRNRSHRTPDRRRSRKSRLDKFRTPTRGGVRLCWSATKDVPTWKRRDLQQLSYTG